MKRCFRNSTGSPPPFELNPRAGMTLIEVIVSMTLLAGALLSMGAFIARYSKVAGAMTIRSEANELVADRLETVKGALKYSTIESNYAATEASVPSHPSFKRQTLVTHTGGLPPSLYDYKTVTVIVTSPALKTPAKKSTIISVF
jgi:prepilin-type N-terminal cleavage/methylation domain-containing protein